MAEQTSWTGLLGIINNKTVNNFKRNFNYYFFLSLVVLSTSGFFRGIALSNFTLTVSESVPLERLAAAFGWHMIGKACFVILFGPLIGKITFLLEMYLKKILKIDLYRCHQRLDR